MTVLAALFAIAMALPIAVWLARRRWLVITVTGNSMAPTLRDGQRLIARAGRSFTRGDVIVFRLSAEQIGLDDEEGLALRIKRVAAVESDPMPASLRSEPWAQGSAHVPRGKLVVAGDNPHSQGSRELGYIDEADVIAVVH